MRKLLAVAGFLLLTCAVAQADPLVPPICAPGTGLPGSPECLPGPPVLGPYPVAGEGFMPIASNPVGSNVGPWIDWIVLPNPGLSGPGSNRFLYLYQIESASGAPPITKGAKIRYDDGTTCTPSKKLGITCRDPRGDISRFTLTTAQKAVPFHNFTSFGVAAGDLDNDGLRLFMGTTVPTTGAGISTGAFVAYGATAIDGHNCGEFANLGPGPVPGDAHPCLVVGAGRREAEVNVAGVPFGDLEGDEVGVSTVQADQTLLAWNFIRKIQHGNPGTPEESVILWAMGPAPAYGGGAAIDGDPFSPWSTIHTSGRPVPVAVPQVPEPASLLLLGSGLLVVGSLARRFVG